jgi:hypothetical protein
VTTAERKPRRRTKKGRFKKAPGQCEIDDCTHSILARGMCRKHYERWRRWGDARIVGKAGGPKFTPEALDIAGITARQRNHWAAAGVLGIEQDERTGRYLWNDTTTSIAVLVKRLLEAGVPLDVAGMVAQATVRDGAEQVEIGDGIRLSVSYEREIPL